MNVLLFVMSMLMMLVLMTYGRLESFRNYSFVQVQFKAYMKRSERDYLNKAAIERYHDTHATKYEQKLKKERQDSKASSKLSFYLFVNNQERIKNQASFETQLSVVRNLILFLYGGQKYFVELAERRPNYIDEIFSALMEETVEPPKITKVKELATVDLQDPELNEAFTRMLKGAYEEPPAEQKEKRPLRLDQGYYSLLDFITLENKLKLRVYLASKQLLMAVYGNPALVEEILRVRYQLYRNVLKGLLEANAAAEEFKQQFGNAALPDVPVDFLDFGVSKTNPKSYQ
jgi:hypothetical protein